jgi:hypothetical protein
MRKGKVIHGPDIAQVLDELNKYINENLHLGNLRANQLNVVDLAPDRQYFYICVTFDCLPPPTQPTTDTEE